MLVVVAVIGAAALQPCRRLPARLPPRPAAGNRRAETGEATRRQARVAQQVRSELAVLIRDGATRAWRRRPCGRRATQQAGRGRPAGAPRRRERSWKIGSRTGPLATQRRQPGSQAARPPGRLRSINELP